MFLLTCAEEKYHDTMKALELAKKSVGITEGDYNLDTLALAYFKNGMLKESVETQQAAMKLLPQEAAKEVRDEYEQRLKQYRDALEKAGGEE